MMQFYQTKLYFNLREYFKIKQVQKTHKSYIGDIIVFALGIAVESFLCNRKNLKQKARRL